MMDNFQGPVSLLLLVLLFCCTAPLHATTSVNEGRRKLYVVPSTPLVLHYHKGALLTGPGSMKVYILWYGNFTHAQTVAVSDFIVSIRKKVSTETSVSSWETTQHYKGSAKRGVSAVVEIGGQESNALCTRGKQLKRSDIAMIVRRSLAKRLFPTDEKGIYIVLTEDDVYVERFCMDSCSFHYSVPVTVNSKAGSKRILLGWLGNSGMQCPGQCAWPFAAPQYGPPIPPLNPPNGDVGLDGMIINMATILAGAATNPLNTRYYEGVASTQLKAVTACAGIFGKSAFSGYPVKLLVDKKSKRSYSAFGVNRRMYVLPAMWNLSTLSCKTTLP